VTVSTLSVGQFVIEYVDAPHSPAASQPNRFYIPHKQTELDNSKESLLYSSLPEDEEAVDFSSSIPLSVSRPRLQTRQISSSASLTSPEAATRSLSRSKPEIVIPPAESNIMRAEALAVQYGLTRADDGDHVNISSYTSKIPMQNQSDSGNNHRLTQEFLADHGAPGQSRNNDEDQPPVSLTE